MAEMNYLEVEKLRKAWAKLIDDLHRETPICWFGTITIRKDLTPEQAQTQLDLFLKELREGWLSKKQKGKGRNLLAIVATEFTGRFNNTPHYHVFIGGGTYSYKKMKYWERKAYLRLGLSRFTKYRYDSNAKWYLSKHIAHGAEIQVVYFPASIKRKIG